MSNNSTSKLDFMVTMPTYIHSIALVGAGTTLGSAMLAALLQANVIPDPNLFPTFANIPLTITAINRVDSQDCASHPSVRTVTISDAWTRPELTEALTGQDAVVSCLPLEYDGSNLSHHQRLADAAFASGTVRRFITTLDFDQPFRAGLERVKPVFELKIKIKQRLEELSASSAAVSRAESGFTWTSVVCAHILGEWMKEGVCEVPDSRDDCAPDRATQTNPARTLRVLLGEGTDKHSSMKCTPAQAVVSVLRELDETRNRVILVQCD